MIVFIATEPMPKQTTTDHFIVLKLVGVNIFSLIFGKPYIRHAPTRSPIPDQNTKGQKTTSPVFLGIMLVIPPAMEYKSDSKTPIQYWFSFTSPMLLLPNMNGGFEAKHIPTNKVKQVKMSINLKPLSIQKYANTSVKKTVDEAKTVKSSTGT